MNTPKSYRLVELGGDQFPSLSGAQQAASGILADLLTDTMRVMLKNGILAIDNGLIVPNHNHKRD